jgi:hypothetical protein
MAAVTSLDTYIASAKQRIGINKVSRTTTTLTTFSVFDLAGNPGAGSLPGTVTTSGILQTDVTTGFPIIDFTSGTTNLSKVEFGSSVATRLRIYDMIVKSGAYSYAAGTTSLTGYPVITGRCPDYTGGTTFGSRNEIWIEVSTAFVTGTSWQVQVTYWNQNGSADGTRTSIISVAQAAAALTLGKMFQLSLQAGDTGVQKILSVVVTNGGTLMTAGAFSVVLMRSLWTSGRVNVANGGDIHDLLKTGLPVVYNTSALYLIVQADGTASGVPDVFIELCNG